jgi:hypothetical protein
MRYSSLLGSIALVALCLASGGALRAQDMSKYPDWSGQWKTARSPLQAIFGFQWDPDKGPGPGQQAPLTPEYQAASRHKHA